MEKRIVLSKLSSAILIITPILITGWLILKNGVNIPFHDEWDTPGLVVEKFGSGKLNFEYLISQHNESRSIFPKILVLTLTYLTNNWDVRYGMLISVILCCFISYNIYILSKITLNLDYKQRIMGISLANLLIFSPAQYENLLWGFQFTNYTIIACLITSFVIIYSQYKLIIKFILCAILATISTFSFTNGMVSWLVILPVLIWHDRQMQSKWKWIILGWLSVMTINLGIYFYKYQKLSDSVAESQAQPLKSLGYFLSFLGSPLGFSDVNASLIIGLIIISLFLFQLLYVVNKKPELIRNLLPWLAIGTNILISGLMTTLVRSELGLEQSLSSRYITFSTYLIIAVLYMAIIIVPEVMSKWISYEKFIDRTLTVIVTTLLILSFVNFNLGMQKMAELKSNRLYGKSCLLFVNVIPDKNCLETTVYPSINALLNKANKIYQLGLVKPSLISTNKMQDIEIKSQENGYFDMLKSEKKGEYKALGWAIISNFNKPADAVILAYKQNNIDIGFAIAKVELKREDVGKIFNKNLIKSGWEKTFSENEIPVTATEISAWAFDSNNAKVYKISSTQKIPEPLA